MIDISLSPLESDYIRSVAAAVLAVISIAAATAFVFSSAFVTRIIGPMRKVMIAAEAISSGDLSARVGIERTDEIGKLADSFNRMGMSLEEGERKRKQLIADIAHELRTPLSLIRGNIEAILDGIYPLDMASVASVHEETLFLGKLIDDLRELSLLDAGELQLNTVELDAREMVERAVHVFEHESLRRSLTLETVAGDTPHIVTADTNRIHQVLCNLIGNAIRHTPSGGKITVGIMPTEGSATSGYLALYVQDSGPGISEDERTRIFDRFYRTDASRARITGGSGLGLAISKKIVEAHKGTIRMGETAEPGSRFTITLPVN